MTVTFSFTTSQVGNCRFSVTLILNDAKGGISVILRISDLCEIYINGYIIGHAGADVSTLF